MKIEEMCSVAGSCVYLYIMRKGLEMIRFPPRVTKFLAWEVGKPSVSRYFLRGMTMGILVL